MNDLTLDDLAKNLQHMCDLWRRRGSMMPIQEVRIIADALADETLEARLTDDVLWAAFEAFDLNDDGPSAMRAVLLAALTPRQA